MKLIIKREATFENNSDMEVKVTQNKLSRAFVKETKWIKTCSNGSINLLSLQSMAEPYYSPLFSFSHLSSNEKERDIDWAVYWPIFFDTWWQSQKSAVRYHCDYAHNFKCNLTTSIEWIAIYNLVQENDS